jgi:ABC-type lipoprotein release transport system permease subunit
MRILRIGFLLGIRQIQRASVWTTSLIIFVMMFTFLNLIAVSGILVGLIVGSERAVRESAIGDLIITPRNDEIHILQTPVILRNLAAYPEINAFSVRYSGSAELEANYKERRDLSAERDIANVKVSGIDPVQESTMSHLEDNLIEGEYLDPNEEGRILIGAFYIKEYAEQYGDLFESLDNIHPGSTVRLSVGDISKEFIVKGIIKSKVDDVNFNTYIPDKEFRRIFGRLDQNADQIVMKFENPSDNVRIKESLLASGFGTYAKIKTFEESLPKFLTDIKNTFNLLGTFIGSIGIVVASITIFIIIFINALSRRRHIGILKGIGVEASVIEVAYVLQAAFYALTGSLIGAFLTYGVLIPFFDAHPIQFPFSDGILVADPLTTLYKFIVLFVITLIAGYLPAKIITRENTLNAILGRK